MSILKTEDWDINKVIPYTNNPRDNEAAIPAVAASLKEFGWMQPLVVDAQGVLIVGHTRLRAAKSLGFKTVPVLKATKLTPAQVAAYRLADNKTGELATWNQSKLMAELEALVGTDIDLAGMGFSQEDMGILEEDNSDDLRYLEDFEVMPQPKPKWVLISAGEDDCAAIMSAVKSLKIGVYRMEYSGAPGSHPVHGGKVSS